MTRDTDADWREIGASEPYWGVLTAPQFRRENLDDDGVASFYETGVQHMTAMAAELERAGGSPLSVPLALDFGCGVGRLTEAMKAYAQEVVGYDISPGMLDTARAHSHGGPTYVSRLPDRKFDWINSFIVFQHIPPDRGFDLLEDLLTRLAPQGLVSLHFTVYADARYRAPDKAKGAGFSLKGLFGGKAAGEAADGKAPPTGTMLMYDYDLNRLCETFHRHGVDRLTLIHTDHGGHHGVHILGRREA